MKIIPEPFRSMQKMPKLGTSELVVVCTLVHIIVIIEITVSLYDFK